MALTPAEKQDLAQKIANAKATIARLEPEINKAMLAGVDVSAQKQAVADLKKQILLLEQHYGSGT